MSRLAPEEIPSPPKSRVRGRIVRQRRRRPLHPELIQVLLEQRANDFKPSYVWTGWKLVYTKKDGSKIRRQISRIKLPDGTFRAATYQDACLVRDHEMAEYGYECCWLIMTTGAENKRA